MEQQFGALAELYDELMASIPYEGWVDYVRTLATRRGHLMECVLDVGCGTGTVAMMLAREGCEVVGIDASAEMVACARKKAQAEPRVRFDVQRMEQLEVESVFDTAISLFDSVNYVLDPAALEEAFRRVRRHLAPGGLFIFDMNTPYALEMEMFTQDNLREEGEPKYVWRSRYDFRTRLAEVDMTFYVKRGNTRETLKETHRQRAYTLAEVKSMLSASGFKDIDVYEAYTLRPPDPRTDRAYLVALAG